MWTFDRRGDRGSAELAEETRVQLREREKEGGGKATSVAAAAATGLSEWSGVACLPACLPAVTSLHSGHVEAPSTQQSA